MSCIASDLSPPLPPLFGPSSQANEIIAPVVQLKMELENFFPLVMKKVS